MSINSAGNMSQKWQRILLTTALFPSVSFFIWFALSVISQGAISFSRGDLVVCGTVGTLALTISILKSVQAHLVRLTLLQWSLLLVATPAEVGLRTVFRQPASPWYPNTVREITLAVPLEGVAAKGTFSTNELGLRGRQISPEENRKTELSVLCIGGSTTECFYNSDEHAWPARMERILAAKTKLDVFVGNAGRGGHIAKHHERQLSRYTYASDFDVVVILCGWNDLSAALFKDPSDRPRDIASESLTQGVDFSASADHHVPFYRNLAIARMVQKNILRRTWNPAQNIGWRAVVQDPHGTWIQERRAIRKRCLQTGSIRNPPESLSIAISEFISDLERIRMVLKAGQVPIFITQPTLCRAGLTEDLDNRLWSSNGKWAYTAEATALMLREMNDATQAFCERYGFSVVDAEAAVSGDPEVFYDDCHFTDEGCRQIAKLVADKVAETVLAIPSGTSR